MALALGLGINNLGQIFLDHGPLEMVLDDLSLCKRRSVLVGPEGGLVEGEGRLSGVHSK